jgi:hypothetical protein
MATTQTVLGIDQLKGASVTGELHVYQIPVRVNGTYLTGTKPTFNIFAALQAMRMGISAVDVKKVVVLRDYNDGTNRYTAPNANIVLANVNTNCVNDRVTFRMDSGETNGDASAEIADATALDGVMIFLVVCEVTGA